jgi:hypothetical protein
VTCKIVRTLYIDEPIKGLVRQLILFRMAHDILDDTRPYALEVFQSGWHDVARWRK